MRRKGKRNNDGTDNKRDWNEIWDKEGKQIKDMKGIMLRKKKDDG
jgi:hypothetical protein